MEKRTVIRASVYGFCSGVRRAINLALEAGNGAAEGGVHTLGQLVHNAGIMEMLTERGVTAIESPEEIYSGSVVIRAHGVPAETIEKLKRKGIHVIDATCPKVARSHSIIDTYSKSGYHTIVAGERNHDEVQGLVSRAKSADVVESAEEALALTSSSPAILIAQTTFNSSEYEKIVDIIRKKIEKVEIFRTICPAMENRCNALEKLSREVDAVVVIGGKNSANTRRLYELAANRGMPAWHVEDGNSLPDEVFSFRTIGITAGASTPDNIVQEVQRRLESGVHEKPAT
jgi:4-hydroxy-3-methylbut-2-enyl diphosphate reductase